MTHNTESLSRQNFGSRKAFLHTINITSLDAAGQENYDPDSELNVNLGDDYGVWVAGKDNSSVDPSWDHSAEHLDVVMQSDGSDAPNNSDTGELRLLVVGN